MPLSLNRIKMRENKNLSLVAYLIFQIKGDFEDNKTESYYSQWKNGGKINEDSR